MSLEALSQFRARVNQSPELQAALRPHLRPWFNLYHVVRIAGEHGFQITSDEAQSLADEVMAPGAELTDFELEMVSAGSCVGPQPPAGDSINQGS